MDNGLTISKILKMFGSTVDRQTIVVAEEAGRIPTGTRKQTGSISRRVWGLDEIPKIGELYGFLKKPAPGSSYVCTVFTTKGGALKTTLAFNLARIASLHNIKTCVIGLDLQGDITRLLEAGSSAEFTEESLAPNTNLEEAKKLFNKKTHGLPELFSGEHELNDIIEHTEIPTLDFIRESQKLLSLDRSISSINAREYWLEKNVLNKLRKNYQLIVIDCPPNMNNLISNALVASDFLISPLECRFNHFSNYPGFRQILDNLKADLSTRNFKEIFVPTRYIKTRRLNADIRNWYLENVPGCTLGEIKESVHGEEATASAKSIIESASSDEFAHETRGLFKEIWDVILSSKKDVSHNQIRQQDALA